MENSNATTTPRHDATPPPPRPFSHRFCDPDFAPSRRVYLKAIVLGCCAVVLSVWAVFPIYWGSLWRTPQRKLKGWVVDFDGGIIGQAVVRDLTGPTAATLPLGVAFKAVNASQLPGGVADMRNVVVEQHTWVAVTINPGASDRLASSVASPNATYNGSEAMTFWAAEARNENA
ncbi:hypothetical protein DXG03_009187 [Asterophora parasitica]|uniref:DUF3533 domain-containing protein n=1 Tax=Asterophora parasitica TaxID=117018 RepID=A0A9P7GB39_9AGAR|nr:hypothetical protein DXG03_009187 [Asterophora parasitica]